MIHEDNKRRQAARRFPTRKVRTNTITQKYVSRASAAYNGIKIFHHDNSTPLSSRSSRSMLNISRPIKCSQISNTDSPSHRTTSSRVRNIMLHKNTSYSTVNTVNICTRRAKKHQINHALWSAQLHKRYFLSGVQISDLCGHIHYAHLFLLRIAGKVLFFVN